MVYYGKFDPEYVENCITYDRVWFHNWLIETKEEEKKQAQAAAARARRR